MCYIIYHVVSISGELETQPGKIIKIGETLKLSELGPMIINKDGSASRITNWDKMSQREQTTAWKLIGERNKKRITDLERNGILSENIPIFEEEIRTLGFDEN